MKKNLVFGIFVFILCFALVGCGGSKKSDNNNNGNNGSKTNNGSQIKGSIAGTWEYIQTEGEDKFSIIYEFVDATNGKKTEILNDQQETREFTYTLKDGVLKVVFSDGDASYTYEYKVKLDDKQLTLTDEFETDTVYNRK